MSDSRLRAFSFTLTPPEGVEKRDHLQRIGQLLLDLADGCKGFRMLVATPRFLSYLELATTEFKPEGRIGDPGRIGTWRGYPVYTDTTLDEMECYLAAKRGAPLGRGLLIDDEYGRTP